MKITIKSQTIRGWRNVIPLLSSTRHSALELQSAIAELGSKPFGSPERNLFCWIKGVVVDEDEAAPLLGGWVAVPTVDGWDVSPYTSTEPDGDSGSTGKGWIDGEVIRYENGSVSDFTPLKKTAGTAKPAQIAAMLEAEKLTGDTEFHPRPDGSYCCWHSVITKEGRLFIDEDLNDPSKTGMIEIPIE